MSSGASTAVSGLGPSQPEQQAAPKRAALSSAPALLGGFFDWFGNLGIFTWQVARAAVTPPYEGREFIRQLDDIGSKSLPLVALAGSAIGVVLSMEAS